MRLLCAMGAPPLAQLCCGDQCAVPVFMPIQGTESKTLFTLGRVLQSDITALSPFLYASFLIKYLTLCLFSLSVCAPAVCALTLLCRELWENLFFQVPCIAGDGAFK